MDNSNPLYRLQYSPTQGGLHITRMEEPARDDYKTICSNLDNELLTNVVFDLTLKYPVLEWMLVGREKLEKPSFLNILQEAIKSKRKYLEMI